MRPRRIATFSPEQRERLREVEFNKEMRRLNGGHNRAVAIVIIASIVLHAIMFYYG